MKRKESDSHQNTNIAKMQAQLATVVELNKRALIAAADQAEQRLASSRKDEEGGGAARMLVRAPSA